MKKWIFLFVMAMPFAAQATSYEEMVKTLFSVKSADKVPGPYHFQGDVDGKICNMTMRMMGKVAGPGYSDVVVSIRQDVADEDSLSDAQISKSDKINIIAEGQELGIGSESKVCGGRDMIALAYKGTKAVKNISEIRTTVSENACGARDEFEVHIRECANMRLVFAETDSNLNKLNAIVREKVSKQDARRITKTNMTGCSVSLSLINVIECSWDVSGDLGSDTGPVIGASFFIQDDKIKLASEITRGDKWD